MCSVPGKRVTGIVRSTKYGCESCARRKWTCRGNRFKATATVVVMYSHVSPSWTAMEPPERPPEYDHTMVCEKPGGKFGEANRAVDDPQNSLGPLMAKP